MISGIFGFWFELVPRHSFTDLDPSAFEDASKTIRTLTVALGHITVL